METLLAVVEELHLLNKRFTLERIQRVWETYRRWINPHIMDGGYSLTLDEFLYIVEVSTEADDEEARRLFDRMKVHATTNDREQMDLLEFLLTFTVLCRGSWEKKCQFMFHLLDFDIEDEISEDELAMLITIVSDGLRKLRVLEWMPSLQEVVAMTARGFLQNEIGYGSKMNFNQFLNWCVFHVDPQVLLDFISCGYRARLLIHHTSSIVHAKQAFLTTDPYYLYQLSLQPSPSRAPHSNVRVVCGPFVGQVTARECRVLYEFTAAPSTGVKCCAFRRDPSRPLHIPSDVGNSHFILDESVDLTVHPFVPLVAHFKALTPATEYIICLMGDVAPADLKRVVAQVTTHPEPTTSHAGLSLHFLNHSSPHGTASSTSLAHSERVSYDMALDKVCHAPPTSPTITIHSNFGCLYPRTVLDILRSFSASSPVAETLVATRLANHFRVSLASYNALYRVSANLVVTSWRHVMYGHFTPEDSTALTQLPRRNVEWLEAIVQELVAAYLHSMWPPDTASITFGSDLVVLLQQSPDDDIADRLLSHPTAGTAILITTSPLLPMGLAPSVVPDLVQTCMSWKLRSNSSRLVVVSPAPPLSPGYTTKVSLQNTATSITLLICGSLRPSQPFSNDARALPPYTLDTYLVETTDVSVGPHVGSVCIQPPRWEEDVKVADAVDAVFVETQPPEPLQLLVGPVVGLVTASEASVLVELNREVVLICQVVDRITQATITCHQRTVAFRPVVVHVNNLQPQRCYDFRIQGLPSNATALFQTRQVNAPALHVTCVSHDRLFPRDGDTPPFAPPESAWPDLTTNELTFPSADATLYVGQHLSAHDAADEAMRVWETAQDNAEGIADCFRRAIRNHWRENQSILRRGSHWFVGAGWDWSQYTKLHLSRCVVECAERVAWEYQQHTQLSGAALHRYSYHTMNGSAIGVLHLDVVEHRLATASTYLQHTPELLSLDQWALLDQVLAPTSTTAHCLVITCDIPIVWHLDRADVRPTLLWRDWIMYPKELTKLLDMTARWKAHDPSRNVLFLCGGPLGVKTTIRVEDSGVTLDQLVVGPVANPVESTKPPTSGVLLDQFAVDHACSTPDTQYASVTLVPHPKLAQFHVHQTVSHQPTARVLVGPVLGKVTATSVRVLLEVNSAVDVCTCVCTNVLTQARHTTTRNMPACLPAAFTVVDLEPNSQYDVTFEGIAWTLHDNVTTFHTPPNHPYSFDCVVVHDSDWRNLTSTAEESLWRDILTSAPYHAKHAAATATDNGDGLNPSANLWRTIHDTTTALPLRRPLVLMHVGGQVHLKHAFTQKELVALVRRMVEMPKDDWNTELRPEMQHRLQQVYRVQWNIPPYRDALRVCSNVMLVDDADLYFSASLVESKFDDRLALVAEIVQFIREIAQFVWLYYQNQLWLDVVADDVLATRTASFVQYGHCMLVVLNKNLNPPAVVDDAPADPNAKRPLSKKNSTKSAGIDLTKVAQANNLLPPAAWLALDDAIIAAKHNCKLLCVVVCYDLLEASMASMFLIGVTRLLEKVFDWKNQRLDDRDVVVLMQSSTTTDPYIVTDQRSHATLRLLPVGSITSTRRLDPPTYPIEGGHFSKRFTFTREKLTGRSDDVVPTNTDEEVETLGGTKGYGHLHVTSDLNVMQWDHVAHWLPFTKHCYAITGPILGRMHVVEPDNNVTFQPVVHVSIALEVNAAATIACVVVDVLANTTLRFVQGVQPNLPATFRCTNLLPSTRYAYSFEGLANRHDRKGVFHTPDAQLNAINVVAVSTHFPQDRVTTTPNLWEALHVRLQVPWHGIDLVAHVGGQAPMQSAAIECLRWLQAQPKPGDVAVWKHRLRTRFQQEYRAVWNTPFVRSVLSHTSQLMVVTAADVASFFGRTKASLVKEGRTENELALMQLVVMCAKDVARMYYGALGWRQDGDDDNQVDADDANKGDAEDDPPSTETQLNQPDRDAARDATDEFYSIRMGLVAMFVFDMRSTEDGDVVTCNKRLTTPPAERPLISEAQWLAFERVCRKKSVRVLVLFMEFPLVLSGNQSSFQASFSGGDGGGVNDGLYNTTHLAAHWVACPAQLHQLVSLLFRWKEKVDGRDVVVISGNLRLGLDTFIQDTTSSFGFHNYVTGPIAAPVRPFGFEDSGTIMEKRIAFAHRFAPPAPNYVLLEMSLLEETLPDQSVAHSALVNGDLIHADNVRVMHDVKRLNRWPDWWKRYCPMAATAFWTDLVLKSVPPDVHKYIWDDTALTNMLKPLYAKYNFVDTTRMEALQSTQSPTAAWARFANVLREVWLAMPPPVRQMCADVRDPFVVEIALAQIQLDIAGPIDMAAFQSICKDILTSAARTHVAMTLHVEDDDQAFALKREEITRAKELERRRNVGIEQRQKQEEEHLAELQQRSILEYAQEKNRLEKARQDAATAEREAAKAAKKAARDAEKERQREEDLSIRKEKSALKQMKQTLDEVTASGHATEESVAKEMEWARRSRMLQARIQRREEQKYREGVRKDTKLAKKKSSVG